MFSKEKMLDDVMKVAGGSASLLADINEQIKQEIKSRIEEVADKLDLVPREDFERLETLVKELRCEQDALKSKIEKQDNH